MRHTVLFFDLDETLYPTSSGVWDAIALRIDRYLEDKLHFPRPEIPALRARLFHTYGTTLRGLKEEYHIDELDYLRYVHDIPLKDYLSPNPLLRQILLEYPLRRLIFTNADVHHACRVLDVLGLSDCFDQIIDVLDIWPYCKPQPEAFRLALQYSGNPPVNECIFIDDGPKNIVAARQMGFYTISVGAASRQAGAHASIAAIHELPRVLDPLLNHTSPRKGHPPT